MTTPTTIPLQAQAKEGHIYSHIRKTWQHEPPEERVRQEFVWVLAKEYGFALEQMDEEKAITGRSVAQARAYILV